VSNALTGLFKFRSTDGRRRETLRGTRYAGAQRDPDAPAARRWRFTPPRGAGRGVGRTPTEAIRAYLDATQAAEAAAETADDDAAPSLRTFIADEMDREAAAGGGEAAPAPARVAELDARERGRDDRRDARERGRDDCRDARERGRDDCRDDDDDDVVCTGERTWAERDAALRAAAVDLD